MDFELEAIEEGRVYHVYPTFGREHQVTKTLTCWCLPEIEFTTCADGRNGAILIHRPEQ